MQFATHRPLPEMDVGLHISIIILISSYIMATVYEMELQFIKLCVSFETAGLRFDSSVYL